MGALGTETGGPNRCGFLPDPDRNGNVSLSLLRFLPFDGLFLIRHRRGGSKQPKKSPKSAAIRPFMQNVWRPERNGENLFTDNIKPRL